MPVFMPTKFLQQKFLSQTKYEQPSLNMSNALQNLLFFSACLLVQQNFKLVSNARMTLETTGAVCVYTSQVGSNCKIHMRL